MKIRKAIIPAAGLGTRFLPATKAVPKEMIPIVDKPGIQYIIEEALAAGIEEILVITGRDKQAIEDHFDHSFELESDLERKGKNELLEQVRKVSEMAEIHYIRQKAPLGLGHAVLKGKTFAGGEPVAVLLPDEIIVGEEPCIGQMMRAFERTGDSTLGVRAVPEEETHRYGIVDGQPLEGYSGWYEVTDMVEKPPAGQAPSNLAIIGRYVITPEIFEILEETPRGSGGELQLTDALLTLSGRQRMLACDIEGRRFDAGDKLGFLEATAYLALKREDIGPAFRDFLIKLLETEK